MAKRTTKTTAKKPQKKAVSKAKKPSRAPSKKQQAQFKRERKIRLQKIKHMAGLGTIIFICIAIYIGSIYRFDRHISNYAYNKWLEYTHSVGFTFKELLLEGRQLTQPQDIITAVGLNVGDPLFLVSLDDIRDRLLSLNTVKNATVTRDLEGKIVITLQERSPFVLWQHHGDIRVIDDEGIVLNQLRAEDFPHLITMVGEKAPYHMDDLALFLMQNKSLVDHVTAAVFVSNRRWDIHLSNGTKILLPAQNPLKAWNTLIEMHEKHNILKQSLRAVDLRIEDKIFITLPEDVEKENEKGDFSE